MDHQLLHFVHRAARVAGEAAAKGLSDQKVAASRMNGGDRDNCKVEGPMCDLRLAGGCGRGREQDHKCGERYGEIPDSTHRPVSSFYGGRSCSWLFILGFTQVETPSGINPSWARTAAVSQYRRWDLMRPASMTEMSIPLLVNRLPVGGCTSPEGRYSGPVLVASAVHSPTMIDPSTTWLWTVR